MEAQVELGNLGSNADSQYKAEPKPGKQSEQSEP